VIGYYGAIADWFDSDLVADLAERRPDWRFVLVGSTYTADMSRLSTLPNVETPGEVPYGDLPRWIERMDVLLIPFRRTPLTEATNPVKAYEILAAGRPLVSVPLPEIVALGDLVRLAETPEEMEREVLAALSGDTPEARRRRREFACEQTWAHRVEVLAPAIEEAFPKVSVVVVTWNNREWNARCLASLREKSEWPNIEVIVVDNASTDGSPELLREEAARDPRVRLVLNDRNAGFAIANNQGLALAAGDVLVLLNNDTMVTRGAFASLVRHLRADRTIGLVGPSTNEIANEGKVAVGYTSLEEVPAWAADFVREHDGELVETPMLAMFCLAMTRETWARTGTLDERFEVGMFEDDDYSRRVKELGLRTVCARDSFVHHAGRASFGALSDARYLDIFNKNKARYELKWGLWLPHVAPEAMKMVPPFRRELAFRMEQAGADPSRVVVFLPTIGWNIALIQRPHHLARALARAGYFVVFDCSNSAAESFGGFQEVERNLLLFRGPVEILTGLDAPILWTLPYNAGLVDSWPTRRIVYDCIDDLAVFPYNQEVLRRHHERMLAEADVVACVSRPLLEECRRVREDALYLPNAVDADHFAQPAVAYEPPAALRPALEAGRPILGYYGALASWLDVDLLESAGRLRPDWSFVLVGIRLSDAPSLEALERLPNVYVLPPQPYRDIPAVLACFDVAFIPFVVNEITHATSPLKLFEYFAGGKPVISSPMPECAAFPEVRIARNATELAGALDAALLDSRDAGHRARVRRVAAENSWKARVSAAITALDPGATPPWPGEPAHGRLQGVERFSYQGQHREGRCCVCGETTQFTHGDPATFRESLVCRVCGATSRYRSIARGLLRAIAELGGPSSESLEALPRSHPGPKLRILDTQQPFTASACAYALPDILSACAWIDLEIGLYRPSDPLGTRYGPRLTNQDLQSLSFPDGSLDIVITSDVMEHVRLDEVAHREIHRVLRDGGAYLFTVPHSRAWPRTLVRRRIVAPDDPSRDVDDLPPEYHGDTNSAEGGALAYRAYGTDLDLFLSGLGFSVDYTREDRPDLCIHSTELFFCRKVPAMPPAVPARRR
jgi:GT2 family glycosyltransferase/SAM-dependent methyltransferase